MLFVANETARTSPRARLDEGRRESQVGVSDQLTRIVRLTYRTSRLLHPSPASEASAGRVARTEGPSRVGALLYLHGV